MKFDELVAAVANEDVFTTGWLTVGGKCSAVDIRRQLDRWVKAGKVVQLRRGFYMLGDPWRRKMVNPFFVANRLKQASYVSLQSALAWYGMIPEYVPETTSVTTGRPEILQNPVGSFSYQHVKRAWFMGYCQVKTDSDRLVFMATPEKALLDLLYLTPRSDDPGYLRELRFEPSEKFDWVKVQSLAGMDRSPKLDRAVKCLLELCNG